MSLSKLTSLSHLKTLSKPFHHPFNRRTPPFLRFLSFATPEEAAAERRRKKRLLRIEPPLNSFRHNQPQQPQRRPQTPIQNPNAPKLPEHVSALTTKRLDLHNRILKLIRENDLDEASLLTRHSIYSNCKPTIFTCNAVMAALLRQSRYSDLLTLHRFITQAGVAANVVTHNLLINAYCDCRKTDTALEHYKQLINNAPFNPSPTTYRILVKGLVDNGKVDRSVELKDEMFEKGLSADAIVYNYLMLGLVKKGDADKAVEVFEELKEKLGFVSDGVVYGNLMKAYFQKGMEKEAMDYYNDVVGENSSIKMGAVAYNYVLQALIKNGKFDEAVKLFERMKGEHNPPMKIMVNLGSYNVMAEGFCGEGRFKEAIEVFRSMGEKRCSPDTLSVNSLIGQLCNSGLLNEAEEIYREMDDGAKPDEFTYILLIDACFGQNRAEDAAGYFWRMVESNLKPNLNAYNKAVDGLIKAGMIDEANAIFSQMIQRLKVEAENYEVMLRALSEANKLDDVLTLVGEMLRDEKVGLSSEMHEYVRDALRKEGREEDLVRLLEEKEREDREKAEALARKAEEEKAAAEAKNKSVSIGSLSWLSGVKGANSDAASGETETGEAVPVDATPAVGETTSVSGDTPTGNLEGTEAAVPVDATPAVSETTYLSGDTPTNNLEGTEEAVPVNTIPTVDVVEEAVIVNDLSNESETPEDGAVEEATV